MARIEFTTAGAGLDSYKYMGDYTVSSYDEFGVTWLYDPAKGGAFNAGRSPWRIEASLKDVEWYIPTTGPDAGNQVFLSGEISSVEYYSDIDELQLTITDIAVDVGEMYTYVAVNSFWRGYDLFVAGGSTFIGSSSALGEDIETGAGNDVVRGRGGDDWIRDSGGRDVYNGGSGKDGVTYDGWFWDNRGQPIKGIVADLEKGQVKGPDGKIDKLFGIEEIGGTHKKDVLLGNNDTDNFFQGLRGKDVIDGRGGWDMAAYHNDHLFGGKDGIVANLKAGTIRDGFGTTDRVKSIEAVYGTNFDDVFKDNKKNNFFNGRDGDDVFWLGKGRDGVDGGAGADEFVFRGTSFGNDTIWDFDSAEGDKIRIAEADNFGELGTSVDAEGLTIFWNGNEVFLDGVFSVAASDFIFV